MHKFSDDKLESSRRWAELRNDQHGKQKNATHVSAQKQPTAADGGEPRGCRFTLHNGHRDDLSDSSPPQKTPLVNTQCQAIFGIRNGGLTDVTYLHTRAIQI